MSSKRKKTLCSQRVGTDVEQLKRTAPGWYRLAEQLGRLVGKAMFETSDEKQSLSGERRLLNSAKTRAM